MKLQEIRLIAKSKGVKPSSMKKDELIRAMQKAEGNTDCFGSTAADGCKEMNCLWRTDCLTTS